jgi:uncharacterized protein (TIGR04255 family)
VVFKASAVLSHHWKWINKYSMGQILNNKPLIEAIFELRWGNPVEHGPGATNFDDPNYQILLGRLFDRLKDQGYSHYEKLPSADVPDFLSGHMIQHRFRIEQDQWPLIQLGKGVLTVNDTVNYDWDKDFYKRCKDAVIAIHDRYPGDLTTLPFQMIALKYIDAYVFDFESNNVFDFIKQKMSLDIRLPDGLLATAGASGSPDILVGDFGYKLHHLPGLIKFKLGRGKRTTDQKGLLVWETEVQSIDDQVPIGIDNIAEWLDKAHTITSAWFDKIIEGDLKMEFE